MTQTQTATLYCYVHPNRESTLRCNRCERPICAQCAIRTPTGYRCRECVRQQQKTFDTAVWSDYLIGFAVTSGLSLVAAGIIAALSLVVGFYMILVCAGVGYGAGRVIADAVLRFVRRRSRALFRLVAAGVIVGALPMAAFYITIGDFFSMIWLGIYLVIATPTVYRRFSGLQF